MLKRISSFVQAGMVKTPKSSAPTTKSSHILLHLQLIIHCLWLPISPCTKTEGVWLKKLVQDKIKLDQCAVLYQIIYKHCIFGDGETHNQKELMIFWPFVSVEGCAWIFMLVYIYKKIHVRLLTKFEIPARKTNKGQMNVPAWISTYIMSVLNRHTAPQCNQSIWQLKIQKGSHG